MPTRLRLFTWILILGGVAASGMWLFAQAPTLPQPPALALAGQADITGFARALAPIPFTLPQDHGPHFDYQTEWWYYTGNLDTAEGRHFGYQLTFFRRGLTPGAPPAEDNLTTNQIYFAHFAVTDEVGNQHLFAERFSRGAGELAGGMGQPFRVWLENWSAEALDAEGSAIHLRARDAAFAIDLTLRAAKPIVAHGDNGLSPKSAVPGNASYYLSYTRLTTEGQVTVNDAAFAVKGESWFDHEWSTSALGASAIGWDWFSLQLSDGREVMFFQIRRADGTLEPVSGGTLIEADGTATRFTAPEVELTVSETWRSPVTRADYPAQWHLVIPAAQIDLQIEPWVAEQEMRVTGIYWEGAVRFTGTSAGAPITGNGYIELTGYAMSLKDTF